MSPSVYAQSVCPTAPGDSTAWYLNMSIHTALGLRLLIPVINTFNWAKQQKHVGHVCPRGAVFRDNSMLHLEKCLQILPLIYYYLFLFCFSFTREQQRAYQCIPSLKGQLNSHFQCHVTWMVWWAACASFWRLVPTQIYLTHILCPAKTH